MNDALYKVTGQAMHAAHMLYLSLAHVHQAICEQKRDRVLTERFRAVLQAEDALAEALALWKQDFIRSVSPPTGSAPALAPLAEPGCPEERVRTPFACLSTVGSEVSLFVGDTIVASVGDLCHDPEFRPVDGQSQPWTFEMLEAAAARINAHVEARR